jgi:hypothetical protein
MTVTRAKFDHLPGNTAPRHNVIQSPNTEYSSDCIPVCALFGQHEELVRYITFWLQNRRPKPSPTF